MPVKNKIGDEHFLRNVPLPEETKSYTVISHGEIIDKVETALNANNFYIKSKKYQYSFDGEVVLATLEIHSTKDLDIGMTFNWCNSYNKKLRFGCYIGGFIYSNNATLIGSDGINWLRKHTGTANSESMYVIDQVINYADEFFDNLIIEKNDMRNTPISESEYSNILGDLYFNKKYFTSSQSSSIIKTKEDRNKNNDFVDDNNLWGLYKDIMHGLNGSDLTKWQLQQQKIHYILLSECVKTPTNRAIIDISVSKNVPMTVEPLTIEQEYVQYCVQNSEYNEDLVNYYMLSNSIKGLTEDEFLNNFLKWAGGSTVTDEEPVDDTPQITGIPNGTTISDTDDEDEDTPIEQIDLEESIHEVKSEIHIETANEYNARVAQIEGEPEIHIETEDEYNVKVIHVVKEFETEVDSDIEDLLDLL